MFEHVGATFTLSFLLVIVAALILYRPDPPLQAEIAAVQSPPSPTVGHLWSEGRDPSPPVPEAVTGTFPGQAVAEDRSEARGTATEDRVELVHKVASSGRARIRPSNAREGKPRQPESPFTIAEPGEKLADVAMRVYGPLADLPALWQANRDLVDRPDANLRPGMVLRTPSQD